MSGRGNLYGILSKLIGRATQLGRYASRGTGCELSSWIICSCGKKLNKNLFSGNRCILLVPEARLDNEVLSETDISRIIVDAEIMLECPECHRIIIINDQQNVVRIYQRVGDEEE